MLCYGGDTTSGQLWRNKATGGGFSIKETTCGIVTIPKMINLCTKTVTDFRGRQLCHERFTSRPLPSAPPRRHRPHNSTLQQHHIFCSRLLSSQSTTRMGPQSQAASLPQHRISLSHIHCSLPVMAKAEIRGYRSSPVPLRRLRKSLHNPPAAINRVLASRGNRLTVLRHFLSRNHFRTPIDHISQGKLAQATRHKAKHISSMPLRALPPLSLHKVIFHILQSHYRYRKRD